MKITNGLLLSKERLEEGVDLFTGEERGKLAEDVLAVIPGNERVALDHWIRNHIQYASANARPYWLSVLAANAAFGQYRVITRQGMLHFFDEAKRARKVVGILVPT